MGQKPRIERQIAQAAARQHGNITRPQILAFGVSPDWIDRRVKTGRLYRVHFGVYAVGRPPMTNHERAAAAVLAGGPKACLSDGSAMSLWGFWKDWHWPAEITIPVDRRPRGIRTHRRPNLARRDITTHFGIRVTTPARTLLDIAPCLGDRALTRAVNDGRLSRYLQLPDLIEILERCPHHPAARRLEAVLRPGAPTRSALEDKFRAFCERFGLPPPEFNVIVGGYEVDAFFEAERVIVELDGYEYHSDRATFESDRERDAHALAHGCVTIRITERRLDHAPEREAARVHAILRARRTGAA